MSTKDKYFDDHGNPTSLRNLVQTDPDWACSRIRSTRQQLEQLGLLDAGPLKMANIIVMPRALTAENGAMDALSGEFFEHFSYACPHCSDDDGIACDECADTGYIGNAVPVGWTTIKEIYAKCVELLEVKP